MRKPFTFAGEAKILGLIGWWMKSNLNFERRMNSARQQRQVLENESLESSVCCCFIMNGIQVCNDLKIVFEKIMVRGPFTTSISNTGKRFSIREFNRPKQSQNSFRNCLAFLRLRPHVSGYF